MKLESRDLRIPEKLREAGTLTRELMGVRMFDIKSCVSPDLPGDKPDRGAEGKGQHDDLVVALALAVWRAGRF